MGKTLLELLDTYPFDPRFNPNKQTDDMLKPDPSSAFDTNIKQSKDWLKATPKLYGADIVRIMSQGQVDTKKLKKAAVKIASKVVSKIPIVGGIAGGAISQLTNPKLPGDLYTGLSESVPDQMIPGLYTDLIYGRIRNGKGVLGNFLRDNASLKNLGANLKNTLVSAAIGGATKLVSAGLDALINGKKLTLRKKKLPAVKRPFGQLYPDNFPSTFAFQSGVTDNIAVNQTQFSNRPGLLGGLFGAGFELGKEESKIKIIKLSNTPAQDGLVKGTSNRLDDFYSTKFLEVSNKLDGFVPAVSLQSAKDSKSGNPFNYETLNGISSSYFSENAASASVESLSLVYGSSQLSILSRQWDAANNTGNYFLPNSDVFGVFKYNNQKPYKSSFNDVNSTVNADGSRDYDTGSLVVNNRVYYTSLNFGAGDNLLDDPGTGLPGGIDDTTGYIRYKGNPIARQAFNDKNTFLGAVATAGGLAKYDTMETSYTYFDGVTTATSYHENWAKLTPYPEIKKNVLNNTSYDIVELAINGVKLLGTITGLSDDATPSWTDTKSIGSGFKFYLYDTWEREISFKFQMYADNNAELDLIWKKAEAIKKLTLPTPKGNIGVFGELISLRIGDIINTPHGFLTGCNLTVTDDSPWEITQGGQKPFIFEMDITYKVVSNTDNTSYTFYS
jgi:hypothetical protein